jgi:hypothetical protein
MKTGFRRTPRQSLRQIFVVPLAIGILSSIGLVTALVGDGWWDGLSWIALAIPVALLLRLIVWPAIARSRSR